MSVDPLPRDSFYRVSNLYDNAEDNRQNLRLSRAGVPVERSSSPVGPVDPYLTDALGGSFGPPDMRGSAVSMDRQKRTVSKKVTRTITTLEEEPVITPPQGSTRTTYVENTLIQPPQEQFVSMMPPPQPQPAVVQTSQVVTTNTSVMRDGPTQETLVGMNSIRMQPGDVGRYAPNGIDPIEIPRNSSPRKFLHQLGPGIVGPNPVAYSHTEVYPELLLQSTGQIMHQVVTTENQRPSWGMPVARRTATQDVGMVRGEMGVPLDIDQRSIQTNQVVRTTAGPPIMPNPQAIEAVAVIRTSEGVPITVTRPIQVGQQITRTSVGMVPAQQAQAPAFRSQVEYETSAMGKGGQGGLAYNPNVAVVTEDGMLIGGQADFEGYEAERLSRGSPPPNKRKTITTVTRTERPFEEPMLPTGDVIAVPLVFREEDMQVQMPQAKAIRSQNTVVTHGETIIQGPTPQYQPAPVMNGSVSRVQTTQQMMSQGGQQMDPSVVTNSVSRVQTSRQMMTQGGGQQMQMQMDPSAMNGSVSRVQTSRQIISQGGQQADYSFDNYDIEQNTMSRQQIELEMRNRLSREIRSQLEMELRQMLTREIRSQVEMELTERLSRDIRAQLEAELWDRLSRQLRSQIETELRERITVEVRGQNEIQLRQQITTEIRERVTREVREQLAREIRMELEKDFGNQMIEVKEQTTREIRVQLERDIREETAREIREITARETREQVTREMRAAFEQELGSKLQQAISETRMQVSNELRQAFEVEKVETVTRSVAISKAEVEQEVRTRTEREVRLLMEQEVRQAHEQEVRHKIEIQLRRRIEEELTEKTVRETRERTITELRGQIEQEARQRFDSDLVSKVSDISQQGAVRYAQELQNALKPLHGQINQLQSAVSWEQARAGQLEAEVRRLNEQLVVCG